MTLSPIKNIYDTVSERNLNENNFPGPYGPVLYEKIC
jgi:hypothetical protein